MIYRKPRTHSYAQIDNAVLRDPALSWKARGLLAYLLSLPDDWEVSFKHLALQSPKDTKNGLRSAFKELTTIGYARLEYRRSSDGSRASGKRYSISEEPFSESQNPDVQKAERQKVPSYTKTQGFNENPKKTKTKNPSVSPAVEISPQSMLSISVKSQGAKRCPTDYIPGPFLYAWAAEKFPHVDVENALEAMRDWEFKTARHDWDAVLRTWIRNEAKHTVPMRLQDTRLSVKGTRTLQASKNLLARRQDRERQYGELPSLPAGAE